MRTLTYYFLVLDIENSTIENEENQPIGTWLTYGYCKLYSIDGSTVSKCMFREWSELKAYLREIEMTFYRYKILCFVHNLSYEFDFLVKNISRPKTLLSNSSRNVISSVLEEHKNIEFRCTYQISGYSLREIGRQLDFPKLDSEYRFILPSDELTYEEIEYCERDCDIVAKYVIDVLLKEYRNLNNIPFTKTGRVRKRFKELYSEYENKNCKWDLPPNEDCYQALEDAFCGGLVISNPKYTGYKLYNIKSKDETSAYPFVMLKEQYPYTIKRMYKFEKSDLKKHKFWIAKIKFNYIMSKYDWNWLSISKMNEFDLENSHFFNGKLIEAKWIVRTITNIDFEMIEQTYQFNSFEILEFYVCDSWGYLPECYIKLIEEYGEKKGVLKTKLKQVENEYGYNSDEYLETYRDYMLAKNDYNSIYGMTVQKLMQSEYIIDENFLWKEVKQEYKKTDKHMRRNFLIGLYVTAYARRNLLRGILKNCPYTLVYADTDSIKYIDIDTPFIDTNERLAEPFCSNPYLCNLGEFEDDGNYDEFITFGAKKYAFKIGDIYDMRVAGIPRFDETNPDKLTNLNQFYCGRLFKNCKLGKKYINNDLRFELDEDFNIVNVEEMDEVNRFYANNNILSNGGVALFPTSYLLDMTNNDKYWIKQYQEGILKWAEEMKLPISTHLTIC